MTRRAAREAEKAQTAGIPTQAMPSVDLPTQAMAAVDLPAPARSAVDLPTQAMPAAGQPTPRLQAHQTQTQAFATSAPFFSSDAPTTVLPSRSGDSNGGIGGPGDNGHGGGNGGGSSGDDGDDGDAGGGIGGVFRRHPKAWLAAGLSLAFVLAGTGAVAAGLNSAPAEPAAVAAPVPSPTPTVEPARPVLSPAPAATPLRTCTVAGLAGDPRLANLHASVLNAATGEVLFDRNATTPERTASVMKTVTAAAALAALGPEYRITTSVQAGPTPESIVLVGGGDATLSQVGPGSQSFYRGAPKLSDLAAQVRASLPAEVTSVDLILDANLWDPADKWDGSWERRQQTVGYMSEVTALQVDADRADPNKNTSPRSTDPIGRAGDAFKAALAAEGIEVRSTTTGIAGDGAADLASVQSQPVSTLIGQMMDLSDNTLAEMLARLIAIEQGLPGTFASLQQAYAGALSSYGIPTTGMVIRDGSGLSEHNRVAPVYVAQLMAKAVAGEQHLKVMYDTLPISGRTGTLASRFTGDAAVAKGYVNAKTGWIQTGRTLAGIVHAADGSQLAFAFYAVGTGDATAMPALDSLTAGVYSCGNNLSNH